MVAQELSAFRKDMYLPGLMSAVSRTLSWPRGQAQDPARHARA